MKKTTNKIAVIVMMAISIVSLFKQQEAKAQVPSNPLSVNANRGNDSIVFTCIGGTPGTISWYQADTNFAMPTHMVMSGQTQIMQPLWAQQGSVGFTTVSGFLPGGVIRGLNPNLKYYVHVATATNNTDGICVMPVSTSAACPPPSSQQDTPSIGGTIHGSLSIVYGDAIGLTLSGQTGSILWWEEKFNDNPPVIINNITDILSKKPSSVGTYKYKVWVKNGTYPGVYSSEFSVSVSQRPLTIKSAPKTKDYDGLITSFSIIPSSGFASGENLSSLNGTLDFEGTAISATDIGSYLIMPKGLSSSNYAITYDSSRLIINPASSVIVFNTLDNGPGSLRKAITNIISGGTIYFASSIDAQNIVLTSGSLIVDKNITMNNSNHFAGLTISGTGDNVVVNSGKILTLGIGSKFTITMVKNNGGTAGLVIDNGVTFITNTIDLPATVKKTFSNKWHLFGSPFKQGMGNSLSCITPVGGSAQLKPYTNGTNWLANVTSPLYFFQPTVGYAYCPNLNLTATLTGTLWSSGLPAPCTYNIPLVYNGTGATQSWNLLSNPFPSYLDWRLLTKTNVSTTLYLWDPSLAIGPPVTNTTYFRVYNAANGVGVPSGTKPFITSGEGFFVRCIYTTPSLGFPTTAKTHSYADSYKESNNTQILVRLKTETNMGYDELAICKNPDAALNYEEFDSEKMMDGLPVTMVSLAPSGEKLVVNTINDTNTVIPLSITGATGDKATIIAFDLESSYPVYLEDRLKGKIINLSENSSYTFDFPNDEVNGRFYIRFKDNTISSSESNINIFQNAQQLNIVAQTGEQIQSVEVYSLTGACIYKATPNNSNIFSKVLNLSSAIYLVKVKTSLSIKNVKVSWE